MVFTRVKSSEERFRTKYAVSESGCWEWQGATNGSGYGVFWVYTLGRNDYAHRASYQMFVGEIPEGLEIDHLCENTLCVNPEHLEPVTHAENLRRKAMRRTHCPSGHPWDANNTRIYRGHRRCKACDREAKNMGKRREDQCRNGHERTPENVYFDPRGARYCRACRREVNRRLSGKSTEQYDLGKWVPSSKEVDNVRNAEDAGQTNPTDGSSL